ncbi:AAA family ATPase [Salipaludibacillus daqingensis]|uniref:AAA family ATPase n=1 Tax=Salipaludibacillus daqingensis TaxID=3041001 RepID=UPI0024772905|nr:AAA family ATPase [Salipaludibacillus daqingensis]
MDLQWLFYSDTNAKAEILEETLLKRQYAMKRITYLERLFDYLKKNSQVILIIKANTVYNVYQLSEELSVKYPHVYIILMVPDNMENVKKAMQAGASNTLRFSSDKDEVREVIVQAEKYMHHRFNQEDVPSMHMLTSDNRVISVCSTKGGVGRTSLTVNLAVGLAKQGQRVAVLDGDVQFGDVAMYLDLKPKKTIYEWVKEGEARKELDIDKYMTKHDSGVSVLAAPSRPEFFEIISAKDIRMAIEELKKIYTVILIDNSSYLSEINLQCIEEADELLFMTNGDLPSVRNLKLYMDTLASLNLTKETRLILNQKHKKSLVDGKKVSEITGLPIYASLPKQENIVDASINEGLPYVVSHPRKPLSKEVLKLSGKLVSYGNSGDEKSIKKVKRRFAEAK